MPERPGKDTRQQRDRRSAQRRRRRRSCAALAMVNASEERHCIGVAMRRRWRYRRTGGIPTMQAAWQEASSVWLIGEAKRYTIQSKNGALLAFLHDMGAAVLPDVPFYWLINGTLSCE